MTEENLTPVPDTCRVLRLARLPLNFAVNRRISAVDLQEEFTLSTKDKESDPPYLSVWVDSLTTPEQAYTFLGESSPRKLALRLKVNEIRIIKANFEENFYPDLLDVIWVHIVCTINNRIVRDPRTGADGHSGIIGIDEKSVPSGLTKPQWKVIRKDLRVQLAELASQDYFQILD